MHGFNIFKYPVCRHSVAIRDFSSRNGDCHAQATKAMNEHATDAYGGPIPVSAHDAQMWYSRKIVSAEASLIGR